MYTMAPCNDISFYIFKLKLILWVEKFIDAFLLSMIKECNIIEHCKMEAILYFVFCLNKTTLLIDFRILDYNNSIDLSKLGY